MEFTIFEEKEIFFQTNDRNAGADVELIMRESGKWLKADVIARHDLGNDCDNFSWRLKHLINKVPWNFSNQFKNIDWKFGIKIFMKDLTLTPASVIHRPFGRLTIFSRLKDNFLNSLQLFTEKLQCEQNDVDVSVNIYANQFGLSERSENNTDHINLKIKGLKINNRPVDSISEINFEQLEISNSLMLKWKQGLEFSSFIRITIQLSNKALGMLYEFCENPGEKYCPMKNMLNNEICTDLVISVGKDNTKVLIKCHRGFLAAHSKCFHQMLTCGMAESIDREIKLENNTEDGIRAVLAFLYYRDIKAISENITVAFEVLQVAEMYDFEDLWNITRDIILMKDNSWFKADVLLSMYAYIRSRLGENLELADNSSESEESDVDMEISQSSGSIDDKLKNKSRELQWEIVKQKCLIVLKWYIKTRTRTLFDCETYKEMLKENPQLLLKISRAVI